MILGFLISLIGLFFLIVNTVLFVTNKTVVKRVSKIFIIYLITLSVIEVFCHVIGFLYPNSNSFISHFYFNFQFIFLSYLFYNLFKSFRIKKIILILFFCVLGLIVFTYIENPLLFWEFNPLEIVSTSLFLIILAVFFICKNLENIHDYFNFSLGLIMYLINSIYIFMFGNTELVICEKPYIDIWVLNSIFYILFQIMIFKEYLNFKNKN